MRPSLFIASLFTLLASFTMALPQLDGLDIVVQKENPSAKTRSTRGDNVKVHVRTIGRRNSHCIQKLT